jgi:hypothetical protein
MERLTITAQLKVPIILGSGYLTLDALIAALIFERTGDVEAAHKSVPLACTDGLFHASAALLEPFRSSGVAFVANLRATHALDPDLLLKNKNGKIHKQIGLTRRRDFGAVMNNYPSFDALRSLGTPRRREAVERLLSGVTFIGKRRGSGFGEVSGWSVEAGDFDGVVGPVILSVQSR